MQVIIFQSSNAVSFINVMTLRMSNMEKLQRHRRYLYDAAIIVSSLVGFYQFESWCVLYLCVEFL